MHTHHQTQKSTPKLKKGTPGIEPGICGFAIRCLNHLAMRPVVMLNDLRHVFMSTLNSPSVIVGEYVSWFEQ